MTLLFVVSDSIIYTIITLLFGGILFFIKNYMDNQEKKNVVMTDAIKQLTVAVTELRDELKTQRELRDSDKELQQLKCDARHNVAS